MAEIKQLNSNGHHLSNELEALKLNKKSDYSGQYINVAGVGRDVSVAYEQLRNATEYTQEHLLVQKAIRRFFVRNLSFFSNHHASRDISEELIIELIQSGYIENNSQPVDMIEKIDSIVQDHYGNYWRFRDFGIKANLAQEWTLDLLSVECEKMIKNDAIRPIFAQFAYRHYQSILQKEAFIRDANDEANFEASIYVAVYRSLFKSEIASVRYDMQKLYNVSDKNISEYAKFHENVDKIFESDLTDNITSYINKFGAPLRVLKNLAQNNVGFGETLKNHDRFKSSYLVQVEKEYNEARAKLNKGLIKSVAFLFITKSLIGVAIEVPYDLMTVDKIVYVPLIVNLLAPVIYMVLLRFSLKLPSKANTKAIEQYADNMLYGNTGYHHMYHAPRKVSYPIGFKIAFILMFLMVFGIVTNILISLEFNIVQGAIFFIFFATANFLGFSLSRIVRELELINSKSGFFSAVRDFIYMPFILLGQWISDKYKKVNIVALVLDTIIELPLKTILRLIRQWTEFLNDKKDQIN